MGMADLAFPPGRMSLSTSQEELEAEIRNSAWFVRHYWRNRVRREQAIIRLGLAVGHAFTSSQDYEKLLRALLDSLRPKDDEPL